MKLNLMLLMALTSTLALAADNGSNFTNPNAVLAPYVWATCESPSAPAFLCKTFKPGNETYALYIHGQGIGTSFHYIVTGTRADGVVLTVDDVILRKDVGGVTLVIISFGAPVSNTTVKVVELNDGLEL